MIISDTKLQIPQKKRDLYIAHEIIQLKLLYDKKDMYKKFLYENRWVRNFMVNSLSEIHAITTKNNRILWMELLDPFAGFIQKLYMKGHITREKVSDTGLEFHPTDYRSVILKKYKQRLIQYNV